MAAEDGRGNQHYFGPVTYSAESGTPSGDGLELLATWAATKEHSASDVAG
ncbi:hypothetical protein [Catellatospora sichuanensis]|nr:hypothetical protein [Catellatospora sichuanensis]